MNLTGFTYHITVDAVETELFPYFPPDAVTLEFEDSPDETFGFYRKILQTPLNFKGASYDFLLALEDAGDCGIYDFVIRYNGVDKFPGIIRYCTDAMQWDKSKCKVSVRVDVSDAYTCLLDAWEEEINILAGTLKKTVGYITGELAYTSCQEFRSVGDPDFDDVEDLISDCISGQNGWTAYQHIVDDPGSGPVLRWTTYYVREEYTAACSGGSPIPPPGDGWILEDDNCPTDALYVRALTQGEQSPITGGTYEYAVQWAIAGVSDDPISIDNGVLLEDVADDFNPCSGSIVSDFFTINPDASYPANDPYTEALANLSSVLIFQKSDVKRPDVSGNATNGKWTYKDFLTALKMQFNVEPRIIAGDLRLEHVSYWEQSVNGLDLTAGAYAERIEGLHAYTYVNIAANKFEHWQFADRCSPEFEGVAIVYDTYNTPEQLTHQIERITNDVGYISNNPDSIADDGFVFVAAFDTGGGAYVLVSEENEYFTGTSQINGHLSIPNLQSHYHKYQRLQISGSMNLTPTTFESSVRRKIQVDIQIKIPVEDYFNLDFSHLVKTQIGWGKVDRANYNAASCTLTLSIRHD